MNYRHLDIWKLACQLTVEIHKMTMNDLPRFELYEEGSQIRRSAKSIRSNIVEGYGRRRYKQDFIQFFTYSHSFCDETIDHLEILFETGSLADQSLYTSMLERLNELGRKLNRFIQSVEKQHNNFEES
ncbi:four helix bundle protein [Pontiella sulfatireligans]|uniref:Four helix bundle protein n=1 Tax=Pontiella sulfatireligans TaxID=2750658 RepID=A0A6C2UJ54_9BACT|nr:four helix bundle protein [Pontiella sulfatireligans]VGO20138.1 hypothetical protein SCARR_02199 [Pontiella sulfatireligans]